LAVSGVLCAAIALAGCLDAAVTECADGTLCPASEVCAPAGGCVDPAQLAACEDHAEGDECTLPGIGNGQCRDGVCVVASCGDGVVDPDEVCDDGNTRSGDGCRGDCGKFEICGDGVTDAGEGCDDANLDPADGCDACVATVWLASALVGGGIDGTGFQLDDPYGVAVDARGNVYVSDTYAHRIRRIDGATGVITTVVGDGTPGFSGDGGPATSARIHHPYGVAVDGLGNLFFADYANQRIRRVDAATGIITTVAGNGSWSFGGDGGPATGAALALPSGVAVDGLGDLFIADTYNHRIRRVDAATGIITTIAGDGTADFTGDDGPAVDAEIASPIGIVTDHLGNLYFADFNNRRVRRIDAGGTITTVAGNGAPDFTGDGGPATDAAIGYPADVAVDQLGNLYLVANRRIRRVDTGGDIDTVAGDGTTAFSGDGGPAVAAGLDPVAVKASGGGDLYVVDLGNERVRRVKAATGVIDTIAGDGFAGFTGDGGAATSAPLQSPTAAAFDGAGNLYVSDFYGHRIRRVEAGTGIIATVAGNGVAGDGGDGGPATAAQLDYPAGITIDGGGNLYIADSSNNRIREVDNATGIITTVAGDGTWGDGGDGGPATAAEIDTPKDVALDGDGNLYIADNYNDRIRRVDAVTRVITTVAGDGTWGAGGDGGPATGAQLHGPSGVAVDGLGNLYIADQLNNRVRRVDATTGTITTVAGDGVDDFAGDGGAAAAAELGYPADVALDAAGNLYVADLHNHRVRRIDATTGVITTVAGGNTFGFSGDGGPATSAELYTPSGVTCDATGDLYLTDGNDQRVRRIDATTGVITTVAGQVDPEGMGPLSRARLADPRAMVVTPALTLFAGGASGTVQAIRSAPATLEVVAGRYPHSPATAVLARFRDQTFGSVAGIAYDAPSHSIFLTESEANVVHVITATDLDDPGSWTIEVLAGDGTAGFADGPAPDARFRQPTGLYLDEATSLLYVADTGNHVIRAIDLSGTTDPPAVSTIAGTPAILGFFGDGGPAGDALLFRPRAITRCGNGDLFVADTGNDRIRRIAAATKVITTVLGDGVAASSGQGKPAHDFPVDQPMGLACDDFGSLYVTSTTAIRMLPADDGHLVDGRGQVQTIYGAPPRDEFPAAVSFCLTGIAAVDAERLWVTDACAGLLVELVRRPATP